MSLFLRGHQSHWIRAPPQGPSVTIASLKTRSPDACILRCGVRIQHVGSGGTDRARGCGSPCGRSQGGEPCVGGSSYWDPGQPALRPRGPQGWGRGAPLCWGRNTWPAPPAARVCFVPAWPPSPALATRSRASDGCTAFCPQTAKAPLPFPETRYGRRSPRSSRGTPPSLGPHSVD